MCVEAISLRCRKNPSKFYINVANICNGIQYQFVLIELIYSAQSAHRQCQRLELSRVLSQELTWVIGEL